MLNHTFLNNPLRDWLLAAAVFLVTFLVTPALKSRIRTQRRKWQATGARLGFAPSGEAR